MFKIWIKKKLSMSAKKKLSVSAKKKLSMSAKKKLSRSKNLRNTHLNFYFFLKNKKT